MYKVDEGGRVPLSPLTLLILHLFSPCITMSGGSAKKAGHHTPAASHQKDFQYFSRNIFISGGAAGYAKINLLLYKIFCFCV